MTKALFYLLTFLIASPTWAKPIEKQPARWHELMKLLNQEMKILERAKKKGPELKYRMLELHSERLRLIHEKNNREFLDKSKTSKVALNKESFFKETRNYYAKTKEMGLNLLKEYPQSNRRAEVLYAMGLNSRDYGRDNIAEKYLLESISLVRDPYSSLRHHAETALADHYYNEKRYQEAITYYERAIKKSEDEWLTKHYFNLSWCYLKVQDFDKAIKAIRNSYVLTKQKTYVNIRDQVLDNIGSFYVYAGRPSEGLDFYLKNERDPILYLLPMAQKAADKGHMKDAEAILDAAQKIVDKNKWYKYQEDLYHSYLDFYRAYNRFDDHEAISAKLVGYYKMAMKEKALKLKIERLEDSIEKMRTTAGFIQVKLAKDIKEDGGNYKQQDLKLVLAYFNHLIYLDPKRKVEYLYFRGETYYSVRRFVDAAPAYVDCVNEAKAKKNMDYARKALNSLLALTGQEVLEKELNKKYLIHAYTEHITLWPRDEKSELIYPKLFEIYRLENSDAKAAGVLRAYNKAYPQHLKEQQKLFTKILDIFIEKKDTKKLAHWIQEFKQGFLSYDRQTIEKVEITLGNLLFMEYQELAKKGDKLAAAKGFESIYVNKLYSDKVKSQSAFFAALAYLELAETSKSYYWQALAYGRMDEKEKLEKRPEQLKMAERTYKLQDFVTSYKIADFLLKKFCSLRDDTQTRLYEISIMTALVEENISAAETTVKEYSKCLKKPENRDIALDQIYGLLEKKANFRDLRLFVQRHSTEHFKTKYRFTLQKWFWEKSNLNLKDQIKAEFVALNHPDTKQWLKEMDQFKAAQKDQAEIMKDVIWDRPKFDGEAYNGALEAHLIKVQKFKENYTHLTQSSQVDLAIVSTRLFSELYQGLGEKISKITPKGLTPAEMKDFRPAMQQLGGQFTNVHNQFEKQLDKALREKETLAWGSRSIASVEEVENPVFSFFTGLTMDKSQEMP